MCRIAAFAAQLLVGVYRAVIYKEHIMSFYFLIFIFVCSKTIYEWFIITICYKPTLDLNLSSLFDERIFFDSSLNNIFRVGKKMMKIIPTREKGKYYKQSISLSITFPMFSFVVLSFCLLRIFCVHFYSLVCLTWCR